MMPLTIEIARAGRTLSLAEIEVQAIRLIIESCDGNVSAAARRLGIGRTTIYRKLSEGTATTPK